METATVVQYLAHHSTRTYSQSMKVNCMSLNLITSKVYGYLTT